MLLGGADDAPEDDTEASEVPMKPLSKSKGSSSKPTSSTASPRLKDDTATQYSHHHSSPSNGSKHDQKHHDKVHSYYCGLIVGTVTVLIALLILRIIWY